MCGLRGGEIGGGGRTTSWLFVGFGRDWGKLNRKVGRNVDRKVE